MRALITGVSGQDGRLLSELLNQYGIEITGTTRSRDQKSLCQIRSLLPESCDLISLDLTSSTDVNKLMKTKKFDIIYHFAAQTSVGKSFKDPLFNILSPTEISFNLLEAVRLYQNKTKVIFAGSTEVFGSHGSSAIIEATLKQPMSPYAVGKLTQESVIAYFKNSYDMWISNAYLSNHESLYRGSEFVTMKIVKGAFDIAHGNASALKLGNLSVVRDWGWAPEYMQALFLLSQKAEPEDLIIATGESIALLDFAKTIFGCFDLNFNQYVEHDSALMRAVDPSEVHYNPSKAKRVLNWNATTKGIEVPEKLAKTYLASNAKNA